VAHYESLRRPPLVRKGSNSWVVARSWQKKPRGVMTVGDDCGGGGGGGGDDDDDDDESTRPRLPLDEDDEDDNLNLFSPLSPLIPLSISDEMPSLKRR